jgi:hypothetical protein
MEEMMDTAELEATKVRIETSGYGRHDIERVENWRKIAGEMPYMRFPKDWEVSVIPPFAGAVARFWVRKGAGEVSIYADYYERLGCWNEPHWEIYPDADGDNARFSIATETEEMLAAIGKSLAKQIRMAKSRDSDTQAKPGDAQLGSASGE